MNKYKNKGIGLNAINSYKRASNILDKAGKGYEVDPMQYYLEKMKKKYFMKK